MISVSISAAAVTRNLGFRTNFGIMARDAPPRPSTPTPKTRSLAAIYSLLSRHGRAWHVRVFDDYPSSEELSRSAAAPGPGNDKPLLRAGLLIYIRPWFNVQNVQVVQSDSGFRILS